MDRPKVFEEMKKCLKCPVHIELDRQPHIDEELELEYVRDENGTHYYANIYYMDTYHSVWEGKYHLPVMTEMLIVFTEETKDLDTFTLYLKYIYEKKTFKLRI